jgi:uncharacterized protein (TIGR04442 family)
MIKDIRLHGEFSRQIEFFAYLAGEKRLTTHFYEIEETDSHKKLSFFLSGNYVTLEGDTIYFSGNGGIVSEYMFGSPMPLNDLTHKEILNRLILFGTYQGEKGLEFTSNLKGELTLKELFLDGNSISNTFFLVKTSWPYSSRRTQEELLKLLGRLLKRTPLVSIQDDTLLAEAMLKEISDPDATLLLLRLKHKHNHTFYKFVERHYSQEKTWTDLDDAFINKFADELNIEVYQRKRIAIDILYKSQENKDLLNEYKDILASSMNKHLEQNKIARLNSIRNLSMRRNLPLALFDSLDNLLSKSSDLSHKEFERPYLKEMRQILEGLFLASVKPRDVIGKDEIAKLLMIKHLASIDRENGFEHILLDTGRVLDEKSSEMDNFEAFELFTEIVTYFDRFDNATSVINHLAFMEESDISPEKIRSLIGNKSELDKIDPTIFTNYIVEPVLQNPYSLRFGRRKVEILLQSIEKIEANEMNINQASTNIAVITNAEKTHNLILEKIQEIFKNYYFDLNKPTHINILKKEIFGQIRNALDVSDFILDGAFESALNQFINENEYVASVLPKIISENNDKLREDFIRQAGIDRSRIEKLESEYKKSHGFLVEKEEGPNFFDFEEI